MSWPTAFVLALTMMSFANCTVRQPCTMAGNVGECLRKQNTKEICHDTNS